MKAKINIETLQPRRWLHQAETIEKERMELKKQWHRPTPERRVYACNSEVRAVKRIVSPRGLKSSGEWHGGR